MQVSVWIQSLYPVQDAAKDTIHMISEMLSSAPNAWLPLLLMAVLPAICEELAFRGFILSGMRHLGSKWWAIGITAVFFGLVHGFIQQSMSAAALGLVLGYIAVQTGNLIPCILFHATYNGLGLASSYWPKLIESRPMLGRLVHEAAPGQFLYNWPVVAICLIPAVTLLMWFRRLPYQATREEQIEGARSRQPHHPVPATADA
jgi:sodium transport system permease protein